MNQVELTRRVRSFTRDFTDSIFRDQDIFDFINEGIERFAQVMPEMREIPILITRLQEVSRIPTSYQHLLALYGASRCFTQDERHYQASNMMNEFEVKLAEFKIAVELGEIRIKDEAGNFVVITHTNDHVVDEYFSRNKHSFYTDLGVEGVE